MHPTPQTCIYLCFDAVVVKSIFFGGGGGSRGAYVSVSVSVHVWMYQCAILSIFTSVTMVDGAASQANRLPKIIMHDKNVPLL